MQQARMFRHGMSQMNKICRFHSTPQRLFHKKIIINNKCTTNHHHQMTAATTTQYDEQLNFAIDIAYDAGEIAMQFCRNRDNSKIGIEQKLDDTPVTLVDKQLDEFIKKALETKFPESLVVGEESSSYIESVKPIEQGHVFFVDPIDGTKEFINNSGEWCVMIGLNVDGVPTVGVVYIASRDQLFYAVKGHGTYLIENNKEHKSTNKLQVAKSVSANTFTDPSQIVCLRSRSHDEAEIDDAMKVLGTDKKYHSGSFGIKCALIAQGVADLYINASKKTHFWDSVAPGLIVTEAGGILLDYDGNELQYTGNAQHTVNNVVLFATTKPLVEPVKKAVQQVFASRR
jgi:3'(2'), 5'-bisphosphate nucleotidase